MVKALPRAAEVGGMEGKSSMELSSVTGASYGGSEDEIAVRVDLAMLHCPLCFLPLKPPVFQCEIGHLACGTCRARLPSNQCRACVPGYGAYGRCPGLDVFFRAVKVPCPYDGYGCRLRLAYFDAADHARGCPCAPCACPEPGCAFRGSPATLVAHVDNAHARPATPVRFGAARSLFLPATRRWHVLVAEEEEKDEAVFLLSLSELGAGAAVSLACVRASSGAAAAQYACRLAVDVPNDASDGMVRALVMESKVPSSALSPGGGVAAPDHGVFVHRGMLSGDNLDLSVRISRLPPAGAVVAAAPNASQKERRHQGVLAKEPALAVRMEEAKAVAADLEVKENMEMEDANGGEAGAMAVTALECSNATREEVGMRIVEAVIHCPLCALLLKPPIFQCGVGHLACGSCYGQLPDRQCRSCDHSTAGAYSRCPGLDSFVRATRIQCPNDAYGCRSYVAYCDVDAHRRECPCAPCRCPEPGCAFRGSPPMLRDHISAEHDPPVQLHYGRELRLSLPAARRGRALVGQEDGRLFIVSRRALGAVTAVSVVCVRANDAGAAAQHYTCRLALELPSGDGVSEVVMESKVSSSALSGGAPDYGMFVGAQQQVLTGGTLALGVRIVQLPPSGGGSCTKAP